ncbi:acetyl-CoA carboxylase biotin carboxyl carrier protein [Dioscorea alata]|uniref:Acetyl-CoA carboxylase biotin carboxyl carrier protein n=3 Tax=Dioscorea alata TaxID=55571 RepID=A0ACB7TWG6_DIOAL|nr:acetyl-CoA carboxylase biotin carboxyl carrier protein [Dioscorea alata]KAH7652388.1 acetyl-CoA carboxylase biotin carboxyl carrier protein [Dioscorea alata]KAH7652389.1 acetyl-CoA carboxylase biotin carboxyl carrier protein [Dioscorea alata]
MASISVPCPKCSTPSLSTSKPAAPLLLPGSVRFPSTQGFNQGRSLVLKAQAQKAVESMNSSPKSSTNPETPLSTGDNAEGVEKSAGQAAVSESTISAFMAEVADLVKLVDSRDITELQLKQNDCELIIRKKEALPQPPPSPYLMMQPPPQASIPSQPPLPQSPPGPTPSAPAPALPPPAKTSSSSLPPLKCPMAGNFYRSPAPGEPPFVKVGDKVKKGQVVCIIEAMKLMNEIEADQSGTIVEIIAEDGKPISVDMPLLVIQP